MSATSSVLVDSHCHIFDMKGYAMPSDIYPVVVGYSHSSNKKAVAVSAEQGYPKVLGIAPQTAIRNDLASLDEWVDFIRQNKPNAIGEVGLDYKWAQTKEDVEKEKLVFDRMISLAKELEVPVVIHSRNNPDPTKTDVPKDAVKDILPKLKTNSRSGKSLRFLMHFYSGDVNQAADIIASGGYISVTHMHSKERRQVIKAVPLDRLLVESDAPFIGRTPETIKEAVAYVAEIKGIDACDVGRQTAENAMRFFGFEVRG